MKAAIFFYLGGIVVGGILGYSLHNSSFHTEDPRVAGGNWSIEFQVPPCGKKIQVNWPEREGDVITFYCSDMPVKER